MTKCLTIARVRTERHSTITPVTATRERARRGSLTCCVLSLAQDEVALLLEQRLGVHSATATRKTPHASRSHRELYPW